MVWPHAGARDRKHGRARPYGPALLLSATLLTAGCQVRTDPYGRTVLSTPTLGRALGLASQPGTQPRPMHVTPAAATGTVPDQRVIEGHTVQIMAQGNGHQVVVDGRVLANDTEDDRVLIQDVYKGSGMIYVLTAEHSAIREDCRRAGTLARRSTKPST